jgi:hypothetical protein
VTKREQHPATTGRLLDGLLHARPYRAAELHHELWTTCLLACHAREHGHKRADDRFKIVAVGALPTECCASRYSGSKLNKRL